VIVLRGSLQSDATTQVTPYLRGSCEDGLIGAAVGLPLHRRRSGRDDRRNEGENLGDIYVELYAQGATPCVDSPFSVGSSGCICKGRYTSTA
jgi:hypothetical protein